MTERKRRRQCKACPWKKSTVPERDIPGGYSEALHHGLAETIAPDPGTQLGSWGQAQKVMACHETTQRDEQPCVGWIAHQLGPGNNLRLRLQALKDRSLQDIETVGPQHERFEDTLPKHGGRR